MDRSYWDEEEGQGLLDEWFGAERPLDENLVQTVLKGALDVMIRPESGRVSVLKRGQQADTQLSQHAQAEVFRAYRQGRLRDLLPRRGRNSANLRILRGQ
jgi:hypothetical protein